MRPVTVLVALAFGVGVLALVPQRAPAANASKPRVPVIWGEVPCMTVVVRSQTPVVHLEYSVASEEPTLPEDLGEDEVSDSRRHQFFAFAAQRFEAAPPTWITQADIDRAALVDPMVQPDAIDPEDVLETTSRWSADDWVRITADDMRVPITFEQAMTGVDWDVSAVRPGTWLVKAYTWEPTKNLWSTRWGALKVIAAAGAAADAGPSVILLPEQAVLETGVAHPLPGCVDAPPGSVLTLEYGVVEGSLEPEWIEVESAIETATGALDLEFVAPAAIAGEAVLLRLTIADPDGRRYVAYSPNVLTVTEGPATNDDDGNDGCGCASGRASSPWTLWLLMSCLHRRRRGANLPA